MTFHQTTQKAHQKTEGEEEAVAQEAGGTNDCLLVAYESALVDTIDQRYDGQCGDTEFSAPIVVGLDVDRIP